jgi:hypothetical protein
VFAVIRSEISALFREKTEPEQPPDGSQGDTRASAASQASLEAENRGQGKKEKSFLGSTDGTSLRVGRPLLPPGMNALASGGSAGSTCECRHPCQQEWGFVSLH